jgi:uncharacterized lipoprotein YbaY
MQRRMVVVVTVLCVAALGITGCAGLLGRETATVTGTVVGPSDRPQPVGAAITVWIEDIDSGSSAPFAKTTFKALPGWEVAGTRMGRIPWDFAIQYDPSLVQRDHRYVLLAKVEDEGLVSAQTASSRAVLPSAGSPWSCARTSRRNRRPCRPARRSRRAGRRARSISDERGLTSLSPASHRWCRGWGRLP